MGIDIYLNGYDAYEARIRDEHTAFEAAVKVRDALPHDEDNAEWKAAQAVVHRHADAMWSGTKGYLRSSYNGSGLFRVLEEIYGFDIGEYFFPGDWENEIDIDGREFLKKVYDLQETAAVALSRDHWELPWTDIFTEVTGKRAPDMNEKHASGEAFGDSVYQLVAGLGLDKVTGGPEEPSPRLLRERHGWYLTEGLKELREFGELAVHLNKKGERTFALISY